MTSCPYRNEGEDRDDPNRANGYAGDYLRMQLQEDLHDGRRPSEKVFFKEETWSRRTSRSAP